MAWVSIVLSAGCALVQAYILRVIGIRKLKSEFPVFFFYTCFGVAMVVVGLAGYIYSTGTQYFYIYWTLSFIYIGLEFLVMYEILVNALKPYSALIDLGKMLFRWAAIFLLLAGGLTALATSGSHPSKLVAAVSIVERSMRLMQCGLLLLFFLFEKRLGLSWRNYNMCIALGLGSTAALDLSFSYLKVHFAPHAEMFCIVENSFYIGVLSYWAACLAQPEPARKNVLDSPSRLIFQRWNEALTSYSVRGEMAFAGNGADSFLPGVEQTVDRVLARKIVQ
jgi:hypothetical protein